MLCMWNAHRIYFHKCICIRTDIWCVCVDWCAAVRCKAISATIALRRAAWHTIAAKPCGFAAVNDYAVSCFSCCCCFCCTSCCCCFCYFSHWVTNRYMATTHTHAPCVCASVCVSLATRQWPKSTYNYAAVYRPQVAHERFSYKWCGGVTVRRALLTQRRLTYWKLQQRHAY